MVKEGFPTNGFPKYRKFPNQLNLPKIWDLKVSSWGANNPLGEELKETFQKNGLQPSRSNNWE